MSDRKSTMYRQLHGPSLQPSFQLASIDLLRTSTLHPLLTIHPRATKEWSFLSPYLDSHSPTARDINNTLVQFIFGRHALGTQRWSHFGPKPLPRPMPLLRHRFLCLTSSIAAVSRARLLFLLFCLFVGHSLFRLMVTCINPNSDSLD